MTRFGEFLRDGRFLTRERLWLWSIACIIAFAIGTVFLLATAHSNLDYDGRPLGSDFSNVYAAGRSALHGDAALPFDPARQYRAEQRLFGAATPFYGWHYPPYFLLIAAPLAAEPYLAALALWQGLTLALYAAALWLLLRTGPAPQLVRERLWPALALGFTAVFVNLTHGHNGFLTAALFAAGLALLDRRPLVAGMLFGLLAYKPQFAVLVPLVLVATGRWRALFGGAVTVIALTIAVTALFGVEVWPAFLRSSSFTRSVVLEQGATGFHKIQSAFAAVRLWGGSIALAYGVQLAVTAGVAASLTAMWRGRESMARKGAALCLGAVLATPYSLDYDLMVVAPAIALLVSDGVAHGFRPYEKTLLAALWVSPFATRHVAEYGFIPLGLLVVGLTFMHLVAGALPVRRHAAVSSPATPTSPVI